MGFGANNVVLILRVKIKPDIIIAAYNESKKIEEVVLSLLTFARFIVVIDDCSTDNTYELLLKISKKYKNIFVLHHSQNLGQGAALQTGFDFAKRNLDSQFVVTYDADGQFEPKEIPSIVAPLISGQCDVTLGSRFLGETHNLKWSRRLILKLGILFTYFYSNVLLSDVHNGFRGLNRKSLESIYLTENRMAHASEIIDQIFQKELIYKEIPTTVHYTNYSLQKGQSNMNSLKIATQMLLRRI